MYASGGYIFRRRLILIICLINQLLAVVCEYVPIPGRGMLWIIGLMLEMWTAILYFVYYFFFNRHENDLSNYLLLLHIPIFFYAMIAINTSVTTINIIFGITSIVINTTLAIITLLKTKQGMIVETNQRLKSLLLVTMIPGLALTITWYIMARRVSNWSYFYIIDQRFLALDIFHYSSIAKGGALYILFIILVILSIKEYRKEEKNL